MKRVEDMSGVSQFVELLSFSRLLELINSALLVVAQEDCIALANKKASEMFKMSEQELQGAPVAEFFMPDDREILLPNILHITRAKGEFAGEVMLRRADGSSFIGWLSTSSWTWEGTRGLIVNIHDISYLKGFEFALRGSERMAFLGRMLDDISHQIRNPVLAIGGFARRLGKLPIERKDYVDVILEESGRLELLLTTLTEFLRLPEPRLHRTTVAQISELVCPMLKECCQTYEADWRFACPSEHLEREVLVDVSNLGRALEAVIRNGCEAYLFDCEERPRTLEFTVEPGEEAWTTCFRVTDRGSGIRPTVLPHAFDPFFSTKTGHVGMGLTFARRIVEELGGSITLNSAIGEGTEVNLVLTEDRRRLLRRSQVELT